MLYGVSCQWGLGPARPSRARHDGPVVDERKKLRERLAALNRESLPGRSGAGRDAAGIRRKLRRDAGSRSSGSPEAITYRRDLPRSERPRQRRRPVGDHVELQEALGGVEAAAPQGGSAYVIAERLEERIVHGQRLSGAFRDALLRGGSPLRRRLGGVCEADALRAEDVIFMDLETTGLGATPLFLIGTMAWEDGLVVRQYFARDYSEEPAALSLFLEEAARRRLLVTFNGKSFDVPYVRVRAAATGTPFRLALAHFDLLYECRRAWGEVLPDCRLQTLESRMCGRPRHEDIPGSEIPAAYHAFVRSGNAAEIVRILRHNMLDLVTMAELMTKLPEPGPAAR